MKHLTYIDKFNTIIKGSKLNTGISPTAELTYGTSTTRMLCHFDHNEVKNLVDSGVYPDVKKLKHVLHITNAGNIDFTQVYLSGTSDINGEPKRRATSFDVIFFLIPKLWDRGKGFDYNKSIFNKDYYSTTQENPNRFVSEDGCNWYQARNGYEWDEEGIYSLDTLSLAYDEYARQIISEEGLSINSGCTVIGRQHFDIGNENINLDITYVMNKFIDGTLENFGIGIAYAPNFERISEGVGYDAPKIENYVGFITDKTPMFFEPYVETTYDDFIDDDRLTFALNKRNKLYLYCSMGGNLQNLDEMPTCSIKDSDEETELMSLDVKQFSRGVYYVEVPPLKASEHEAGTMLYDVWDNIKYDGVSLDPVQLEFVLQEPSQWFNIGNAIVDTPTFTPSLSGIDDKEQIKRGDLRKIVVSAKVNYSVPNTARVIDGIDLRLYIEDGTRQLDVIPFDKVNRTFNENFYILDTNMLIPQRYHIDIRITYGMQSIVHHDVTRFDIVDDLNNKYRS